MYSLPHSFAFSHRLTDLERDCLRVSRETIRHVLRQMRDEGLVEAERRGRGARWRRLDVR
ncbi:MAG: hypothetical protein IH855_08965 [Bacteroidetes bacterium]|nr:hypothetical protein [Bacteroidota bacterium]